MLKKKIPLSLEERGYICSICPTYMGANDTDVIFGTA